MSRARARRLWGRAVVARALAHPAPATMTPDLRAAVRRECQGTDATFAAWALTLPPAELAAVVRLVTGDARADLLASIQAADEGGTH